MCGSTAATERGCRTSLTLTSPSRRAGLSQFRVPTFLRTLRRLRLSSKVGVASIGANDDGSAGS